MYKFLPVTLLVFKLGTVYGMTAVASARMQPSQPIELIAPIERREVRIVVVPSNENGSAQMAITVAGTAAYSDDGPLPKPAKVDPRENEVVDVGRLPGLMSAKEIDGAVQSSEVSKKNQATEVKVHPVPFYSQFADISSPSWQKVGCGIASLSMIIDYYSNERVPVDSLLDRGIKAGAYIPSAGWSHAGLIGLSESYGLNGESVSLADLSMENAFNRLEKELQKGPVMASVHYTFEPTNPIPHLVVINGVKEGKVYYNDPAEEIGGGSISIDKFKGAWKKRYISIRPV